MLPAPYVKVYLVSGKKCIDKMKTSTARRTLEPLYQQQLVFQHCNTKGCVLQVSYRFIRFCFNLPAILYNVYVMFVLGYRLG